MPQHRTNNGTSIAADFLTRCFAPGESIEFDVPDASGGQISATSTAADIARLDFGKINPDTGPIFIEGAEPGDVLNDSEGIQTMKKLGENMAWLLKKIKG